MLIYGILGLVLMIFAIFLTEDLEANGDNPFWMLVLEMVLCAAGFVLLLFALVDAKILPLDQWWFPSLYAAVCTIIGGTITYWARLQGINRRFHQ